MDRIYEKAGDVHVRGTYVYVKPADAYAYADTAYTTKIKAADLQDLFLKGLVISSADGLFKPTAFVVAEGVAKLSYAKSDGTTPSTAVLNFLYSEEYVAG
jgi:hypothetical protein